MNSSVCLASVRLDGGRFAEEHGGLKDRDVGSLHSISLQKQQTTRSMLSPVLLDRQFLIMNCDEDSDDDGG